MTTTSPGASLLPHAEPFSRFGELFAAAQAIDRGVLPEPNACSLASVGPDGQPSLRIVLLKAFDERGFVFYTNQASRKGRELIAHPRAALCFHWQPLERQVRVEGAVEGVTDAEADEYFATRPRGSQLGAWASLQSEPMTPGALEARLAQFEARFANGPVPRPPHWSGFRIVPHRIELWHGMPSRLHERILFLREGTGWRVETLYP